MRRKKGFTVIELVICFALISIIVVGMLNIALSYRRNAQESNVKIELEKYKINVTREIQDDVINYSIDHVKYCDTSRNDCITFVYNNGMEKNLEVSVANPANRYIQYDGRKFMIEENIEGTNEGDMNAVSILLSQGISLEASFQNNSSLYKIDIPINHTSLEGDYGIHLIVLGTGTNPGIFRSVVTFDPNGGSVSPTTKEVVNTSPYGDLPIPTRIGYNFDGWYTAKSGGTKVTSSTIVKKIRNHTLYAKWSPKTYIVTFNPNGGTTPTTSKTVTYTKEYGELPTPTKKGHTFLGWYTQTSGGTKIESTTQYNIPDNQTLYAQWKVNYYVVTYVTETSKRYTEKVAYGQSAINPTTFTPSKSGYTFVGWREDKTASSSVLTTKAMPDADITLYAIYKTTLTQTFISTSTVTRTATRYYNAAGNYANGSVTAPTGGAKSGWAWRGWSASGATGASAGVTYNNGSTISGLTGNNTYYGLYYQTVTSTFISYNSTKYASGTRYYNAAGNTANASITFPSGAGMSGWNWRGWSAAGSTGASASVAYNNGSTITNISSGSTYYGLYSKTLTQTFRSTTDTTRTTTRYYNAAGNYKNGSVTAPTGGSKSGWNWRGWSASGVTTGNASVAYSNGSTISGLTGNNTYYGLYSKTLTQTFKSTSIVTRTSTRYYNSYGYYTNGSVTAPTGGTKSDWSWRGWSSAGATGATAGVAYSNGSTISGLTGNNTYYGLYSRVIYLYYNGSGWTSGKAPAATQNKTRYYNAYGNYSSVSFTLATPTNYNTGLVAFNYWRKGSKTGTKYDPGDKVTLTSSTTFYADWFIKGHT